MKLGEASRRGQIITVELIPDRVAPRDLPFLQGRVSAITIPALRNGSHDPSYPTEFEVTPQQRSIASALIVRKTGIEAVPTLTCRDCRKSDLSIIPRFVEDGLENLLIVYGDPFSDPDRNRYEFRRTEQLIRQVVLNNDGKFLSIGAITNQYAPDREAEISRTLARVDAGAEFILTNSVFEQEAVLDHRDELRSAGLDVPLFVQISIPHSLENLLFVSRKFGIPVPDHVREKFAGAPMEAGITVAAEAFETLRLEVNGVHLSYLLRRRSPIPTYCRLLDRIGVQGSPMAVSLEPTSKSYVIP